MTLAQKIVDEIEEAWDEVPFGGERQALQAKWVKIVERHTKKLEQKAKMLRVVELLAEHTDDADMEPVFEVRIPCDWRLAEKGIVACLKQAVKDGAV